MNNETHGKIFFEWTDSEGVLVIESMWGERLDLETFRIDNVPFYTYGISYNDIVSTEIKNNNLYFSKIIKRGGHSTFRIFFAVVNCSEQDVLLKKVNENGATIERATNKLIAIDVPPDSNLSTIINILKSGEELNQWNYEEGFIYEPIL